MKVIGIIPARLESTRLPEKALADICGMPMIAHTYKRSCLAKSLDKVYVATDSDRICKVVEDIGGDVIMTGACKNGTERVYEASKDIECDIVVNIQGDEPLVSPAHIDAVVAPMIDDPWLFVTVGVTRYSKKKSTSDIKAVLNLAGDIMYCSRNDIPSDARAPVPEMLKMCFIVPFRKHFLRTYMSWDQSPLELVEYNEYLRILEHGVNIRAVLVDDAKISVDTPEDLKEVRKLMKKDKLYMENYLNIG
jgi:3-deoxy-manno-octulosonate cytidylyltransferase (CMP-KDO synthetase)